MKNKVIILSILLFVFLPLIQGCQDSKTEAELTEYQNQIKSLTNQIKAIQEENESMNEENQKLTEENNALAEQNKNDEVKIGKPDEERMAYQKQIQDLEQELQDTTNFYKNNLDTFYKQIENNSELKSQYESIFNSNNNY